MSDIKVISRTQHILVNPVTASIVITNADLQRIIINQATSSVSVINTGPMGPAGPQGYGVTVKGSDTYANIIALLTPSIGDMWIQTNNAGGGLDGDGLIWTGLVWRNVGPIQGPQGIQGIPGLTGNTGPVGPSEAATLLTVDGQLLTRAAGVLAPVTRANLAADTAFTSRYPTVVNHGAVAATARPGTAPVLWIGSVDPTNAANDDELFRTDTVVLSKRVGGVWIVVSGSIFVGPSAPPAPTDGKLWWDNDDASLLVDTVAPSVLAADPGLQAVLDARYLTTPRNLIDNGAMNICQRNPAGPGAYTTSGFGLDRFQHQLTTLGTWTWVLAVDAPINISIKKSLKFQCTVANASPAASAINNILHGIEGQFLQHLLWGTASAKPLTVSFWVNSTIAGTYICELFQNESTIKVVSALYTINVAGAWEFKTITFPANTTQAITNDTAGRLYLTFWLGGGSNYTSGVLNTTWTTKVDNTRAVGQVNMAAVASSIQLTGIQMEVGSVATLFETRRFDDELRKCMRYYEKSYNYDIAPGANAGATGAATCMLFDVSVPTRMRSVGCDFTVRKRATPVQLAWALDGTLVNVTAYNASTKISIAAYPTPSERTWSTDFMTLNTSPTANTYYMFHWTASAEI